MGGGRVVRGSIAAAAAAGAVLASAVVDVPEKWHLKVAPMLVYAVPVSMPVVPISSLGAGGSCSISAVESLPGSFFLPVLWRKPERDAGPGVESAGSGREYVASDFSLAQGAPVGGSISARKAIGHLLPVCVATAVTPPLCVAQSMLGCCGAVAATKRPTLAPFCFSTSGLYSAPLTDKFVSDRRWIGASRYVWSSSRDCVSAVAKVGDSSVVQSHSSAYLESLLSSLLSLQSSSVVNPSHEQLPAGESLHAWHASNWGSAGGERSGGDREAVVKKPVLTVVLLGWLGAQQKHLKKYAEWYNARGIHAVTFVIPMTDLLSFNGQGNAEEHVDSLARHLAQWFSDQGERADLEGEKQLIFHTFSNTGWLTYGAILEKMQEQGGQYVGRIKGCVVDSAPVPDPDPQVWASGFSAALLKKRSSATRTALLKGEVEEGVTVAASTMGTVDNLEVSGANGLETAVLSVLEGFFSLFLKLPAISRRLSEVVAVLQKEQPPCPQLYIYSTADKVIPVKAVEAFIEEQRKTGRVVRACNLQSSPHVDHFRSHPQLYSEQLNNFLKEVLPSTPAQPLTL